MVFFPKPTQVIMNLDIGKKYIIGVSHLPGLLGKEKFQGLDALYLHAKAEIEAIKKAGLTGLLLENENDHPYTAIANPQQISSMTSVATRLKLEYPDFPLGVEFLINDPKASLATAKSSGCQFIRTDYWVDKMHREEYGNLEVDTNDFAKYRNQIEANEVHIFADIQVKYATMREDKTIAESAVQAFEAGANAIVVSGNATGESVDLSDLEEAKNAVGDKIVLVGSGFSHKNAKEILKIADGALVGTSLMSDSKITYEKAAQLAEAVFG